MDKIDKLQNAIIVRQTELHRVADILVKSARVLQQRGTILRVFLIILGALTAAQGSIQQLQTIPAGTSSLTFIVLGILIATLAGIETAFRFESRGTELNLLATICHSTARQTDSFWHKKIGIEEKFDVQINGALELIDLQDSKLQEVQEKAAMAGVNITLEVRRRLRKKPDDQDKNDIDDNNDESKGYFDYSYNDYSG